VKGDSVKGRKLITESKRFIESQEIHNGDSHPATPATDSYIVISSSSNSKTNLSTLSTAAFNCHISREREVERAEAIK